VRIDQAVGSAGPYDAVTGQALAYRELLGERLRASGEIYAPDQAPGADSSIRALGELEPGADLLLIHYSGYVPGLGALLELPEPKALLYHNVTPARYFWSSEPHVATICRLGRDGLPRLVEACDVSAAVSRFNAEELARVGARDPRVVPVLLDPERLGPRAVSPLPPGASPQVLVVGRVAPHKRPDLVARAFALFQREHAPEAALTFVGLPLNPRFHDQVRAVVAESGARRVEFAGTVAQPALNAAYAEADVLLSLSEHEGFCIPLLEAFHLGVPVVARRAGGMPEVGGDAVLWVEEGDDLAVVSELLHLVTTDTELREELVARGRRRAEELGLEPARRAALGLVEAALGARG
jgi:glycosyltransferase involved in cell wall biosynthesis